MMHRSTKWLMGETALVVMAAAVLRLSHYPVLLSYEWHRLLHILGAVLFLGNIIVTGIWMFAAGRTGDASVVRYASRMVNCADVFFTVPGVFLIFANGDILARKWGGLFQVRWLTVSVLLFALSGVLWAGFLLRYQNRLIALSEAEAGPDYYTVLHRWYLLGAIATVIPLGSLALMVLQPSL